MRSSDYSPDAKRTLEARSFILAALTGGGDAGEDLLHRQLERIARDCAGKILDAGEEGVSAAFRNPADAIRAAIGAQQAWLEAGNLLPAAGSPPPRMGIAPDAPSRVPLSMRSARALAEIAKPGRILIPGAMKELLPPGAGFEIRGLAETFDDGTGAPGDLFEVLWSAGQGRAAHVSDLPTTITPGDARRPVPHAAGGARPTFIGSYRIVEELGKGGMGVVYLAEQEKPIRRQVALKLIQGGAGSQGIVARFEAERQILALLDHPNIAKVFDAGSTEGGQPYFVMELVRGVPFTAYCDRANLSLRNRLELFAVVCEALHHAHQRGIVHRDVKPTNVLVASVDGRPLPKLIDFGLAKALGRRVLDNAHVTQIGAMLGTPAYMSPEQVELTESGVDARSDIYSLGVMLYEILAGALPFDFGKITTGGYGELRRTIREVDPPVPSARLETLRGQDSRGALESRGDRRSRVREVRGDLDWITMRAIEKDPARRYQSAAELAEEIRRHLGHRPVAAGPPSLTYKARKLVRRRPVHAALAAVLAIALPVGGWLVFKNIQQRREVERRIVQDGLKQLFRTDIDAEEQLARASEILRLDPENLQGLRAQAIAYFNLSLDHAGEESRAKLTRRESLESADKLIEKAPGRAWPVLLKAYFLQWYGRDGEAEALRASAPVPGDTDSEDRYFEARLILDGRAAAKADLQRAESLLTEEIVKNPRFEVIEDRGQVRVRLGDLEGALEDFQLLSRTDPNDYWIQSWLGLIRLRQKRFEEAEAHLNRAAKLAPSKGRGDLDEHRSLLYEQWALRKLEQGDREGGLALLGKARQAAETGIRFDPGRIRLHNNLGTILTEIYRYSENRDRSLIGDAVKSYKRAQSLAHASVKEEDRRQEALSAAGLCDVYVEIRDVEAAIDSCNLATQLKPDEAVAFYNLAGAHALAGDFRAALDALEKDVELGDTESDYLRQDPWFEKLHGNSRFEELLRRMDRAASAAASAGKR